MSINNRSPISKPAETKPRKLRASCDACSRAKVKCDKVRPTCHRCGNMGICCNYSLSMRLGKPRKNRSMDMSLMRDVSPASSCGAFGSRLDMRPRTTASTAESSPEPIDPFFFGPNTPEYPYQDAFMAGFNSRYSPESTTGPSLPGYHTEDLFLAPSSEPLFSTPLSHFPSSYHTGALSTPITMPGHSTPFPAPQNTHYSMSSQAPTHYYPPDAQSYFSPKYTPDPTTTPAALRPLPTPSAAPTSSPLAARDHHDCTDVAFATLGALCAPPAYQPSAADFGTASGLPSLDAVLATTKDAVDKVATLLGCPCSANPHYSTTVAFTIIKILAWHQAVAGLGAPDLSVDGNGNGSGRAQYQEPLAAFTATPVARGAFQRGGGEGEARLRAQVVLGELRRVEELVDGFSERYCKAAAREEVEGGSRVGGVYGSLETLLRTRVRETVKMALGRASEDVRRQWQRREGGGWWGGVEG
ncbi:uncharacterized protein BDZ99DRAFT_502226 [Mytilinidion resinicola]|uniref:Zn(2)-C6 fungal-type domain-containing protein n=1 Tax=Mytilinidion resinicola TaxID=574789 RepID=A0A6A6Y7V4_9PEZI|nr:uncharacterized protein BDZ99DRAFT_502226 [Mytilinidion resinicola]KAF2804760.1 hypothetical protein BDZ99DRAFT_502226 [Mytilinidion resinicola]